VNVAGIFFATFSALWVFRDLANAFGTILISRHSVKGKKENS
jgi:hypothetical protein